MLSISWAVSTEPIQKPRITAITIWDFHGEEVLFLKVETGTFSKHWREKQNVGIDDEKVSTKEWVLLNPAIPVPTPINPKPAENKQQGEAINMVCPVNNGDELLIPLYVPGEDNKPVTVSWSQNLSNRTAQYYALIVDNATSGESVNFFIAAEYYKSSTVANPNHVTKVGQLVEGEGYKLHVDDRLQYGQKNSSGELRFVVFHDKERKPYQHRFIETALGSAGADKASKLAATFGYGGAVDLASKIGKDFIGDYLHTF